MDFGSTVGAIFTILYYLIQKGLYLNFILKIVLSVVMLYLSFGPKTGKEMLKMLIFFYLISFVFGGAALGVIYMVNSGKVSIQNGMLIGNYTIKTIFIGIVLAFTIVILAFRFGKSKFSKNDLFCNITIQMNGKEIQTKAMLDTGNLLKEPITNIPVVVIEHTLLLEAVPKEILDHIENILGGDLEEIPENIKNEYMSKLKVIPFTSLGKQNGMLLGLKADGLTMEKVDEIKQVDKVIIGMYNKKLSKKEDYHALLGIDVLN